TPGPLPSLSFASLIRSLYSSPRQCATHDSSFHAAGRPFAPPRLRLLAPTLRKERTEARDTLDIQGPALGPSPRKEGEVYHIFQAHGQTQVGAGPEADQTGRRELAGRCLQQLAAPVGGAVGGLDHPGN